METVSLETKKALIRKQSCFSLLTEEETSILASLLVEKHFKTDQTIVTEGEPVDSIYLIVSGHADVKHLTIVDDALHAEWLATLGPNTAIGLNETGLYSLSGVRTATVIAKDPMVTLRLSVAALHGFALAYTHVSEVMRKHAESILNTKL